MVDISIQLPEGFLDEEERFGYKVTSDIKKVWAVELDILCKLLEVCKKHDIKIYACGGTILGAVRHKGFIPWDDDIDMMLTRDEYNKLCRIAPEEFKYPYFFQTEYTDPGTLRGHAQIRNSETTAILDSDGLKYKFNQGIFVDIFVYDNVIDDSKLYELQWKDAEHFLNKAFKWSIWTTRYENLSVGYRKVFKDLVHPVINMLDRLIHFERHSYKKFEKICARYNDIDTDMMSCLSFRFNCKNDWMYKEDFDEIVYLPFEHIMIPVCKGYDRSLKNQYGDYMKYEIGTSSHGGMILDTEKSYKEYIN